MSAAARPCTPRTGILYVVQGWRVTDPDAIGDLIDVRENETYVEIPKALLRRAEESA